MTPDLVGMAQVFAIVEKFTREPRELMLRLLGPIADAAGEHWADKINTKRRANLERLARLVGEEMRRSGTQPQPIELTILVPVLQQASLESDDDLMSKWAGLLASAATGAKVHVAYPRILAEITAGEARLLDVLYRWETTSENEGDRDFLKHAKLSELDLPVAGINLGLRHGLIDGVRTSLWKPDLTKWSNIRLTPLGLDFVSTCRGPRG